MIEKFPLKQKPGMLLTRLLPNILTLFALCAGLSAVRYALQENWQAAVIAVIIAGIFDMLDGRIARLLKITSKFGAELDSLSDLVSFGIAPAMILYRWVLADGEGLGWLAVLAYVVCAALRLARFNTMLEDPTLPAWRKNYFTGIPTPAAASLALLPLVWTFALESPFLRIPELVSVWLIVIGGLMVSRLPTFSLKGQRVARNWIVPLMVALGLIAAQMVTNTWRTLGFLNVLYILAMPLSWRQFRRRMREEEPS